VTREGKAREWWTSADGLRCGGEKPRESGVRRARAASRLNSETESSLRKVTVPVKGWVPPFEDREVDPKPRGGSSQPMRC
jgi:hypothetical protein